MSHDATKKKKRGQCDQPFKGEKGFLCFNNRHTLGGEFESDKQEWMQPQMMREEEKKD